MNYDSVDFAKKIRGLTLELVYKAKASHVGGALSMVDILAVLYSGILTINPNFPNDTERDRFLLSKGHACTSLYATLGLKGFFGLDELKGYATNGSLFLSHTSHEIPGVEVSAGSLGHALPISSGIALAAKRRGKNWKTFCLVSDGELNEGSNWESIMLAPQLKLDNLILIVDYNKIQSLGFVKDVIDLEPLKAKFEAFNWSCYEIDGHNHSVLHETLIKCKEINDSKPKVVIANTIKGKGISFMENQLLWHYKSPSEEQYMMAINELTV